MAITINAINSTDGQNIVASTGEIIPQVEATNVSTQRYLPRKIEHTLMNGNFITYTPNEKITLTLELAYITKAQYKYIMNNLSNRFKIISEVDDTHPFYDDGVTYLYSGDTLDFNYSNQFKGAGFSGTLTFLETYETTT